MNGARQQQSTAVAAMPARPAQAARVLLHTVYAIYFFNGMTLCFEGAFNPEFKDFFHLNYQQQMYTMFAKNIPFVLAAAIGLLIQRIGFKNCLAAALFLFAAGTLLLVAGLNAGSYAIVLLGFLVIGLGFNFQLVAGNPLLSALGPAESGSSRLNLGNALGAIAQIIAPLIVTLIIPAKVILAQDKLPYIKGIFLAIAALLVAFAVFTWLAKNVENSDASGTDKRSENSGSSTRNVSAPLFFGFVTIFLILGAEAGLFGFFRNYVEDPRVAGLNSQQSQRLFTVYFAVFALGRLVGAWVQKRVRPAAMLALNLVAALILVGVVASAAGLTAVLALTALGFFISILFPTIYSLAIEGLGPRTAQASGFLTMGFLGCALLPLLQGRIADAIGLQRSFIFCCGPYAVALAFALCHLRKKPLPPPTA